MKFHRILVPSILALTSILPQAAHATVAAYTSHTVDLRAGPSMGYPPIQYVRKGTGVHVHGCVRNYTWCDISTRGRRGWASAAYLATIRDDKPVYIPPYALDLGIPIVTFELDDYWHENYLDYEFYDERDYWDDYVWEDDGLPPGWMEDWEEESDDLVILEDDGSIICFIEDYDTVYDCS
ncbi:SH3 domain-containing protein [Parasphingorhabdus cellanae]|uniref:SH3 domain-containing protein n=1 Tax=Parasphingorhabdus cellanae TaxID=2806553 RepID=A0ABX7T942_9SPHN|nr:SH3 domain-containing protein [Parasphingorhabdus cellanae]QTD57470.1 SH3 domain-containing protein [Parasphingorhabdus cellanae]